MKQTESTGIHNPATVVSQSLAFPRLPIQASLM